MPPNGAEQASERRGAQWWDERSERRRRGTRAKTSSSMNPPLTETDRKEDESTIERIKGLPASIGVILMAAGVVGIVLPGPFGTPLVLAGGLVLAPQLFGKVDSCLKNRYPGLRHHGIKTIERFLDDLQKRYPDEPPLNK